MATSTEPEVPRRRRGNPVRRWGPTVVIVALLAVAIGVTLTAPDAPHRDGASAGTLDGAGVGRLGAGAVPFDQARDEGLDVTFEDTCDEETGQVAMPYFRQPCFADVEDNGGATAPGVTGDTVTVVVYLAPEQDPIMDFVAGELASDATRAQVEQTYRNYAEMFDHMFQTYGREVELRFLEGSGTSDDEVAARADAVRAVEEMGAFAVWGGPALTTAWSEEVVARDRICIACTTPDSHPNAFGIFPSAEQGHVHLVEYMTKKLAGQPAAHAGDPALRERERAFGHLYLDAGEGAGDQAARLASDLAEAGAGFDLQVPYALDPARLQEQATAAVTRLKSAGVTTVVFEGDPIALTSFTPEATSQGWFPEWVIAPSVFVDTATFGRTYDQRQWAHAFGLSPLAARADRSVAGSLHSWYFGEPAPAADAEGTIAPQPQLFYAALQAAGPRLTTDSLRQALYLAEPAPGQVLGLSYSYGDHGLWPDTDRPDQSGIDDFTEVWWDADAVGPDELGREGRGLYRYVDGGRRYLPGDWTPDLRAFEEEGSVTIYHELPEAERARARHDDPPPR